MFENERDLFVRTLLGEAANQGEQGLAAVAHVINNRKNSGNYGDSLQDVILAPKQFSVWNSGDRAGDYARSIPQDNDLYQKAAYIADGVLKGEIPDNTRGATHYANTKTVMQQRGSLQPWLANMVNSGETTQIGAHTFGNADAGAKRKPQDNNYGLPEGFKLDEPQANEYGLPAGFTLDEAAPAQTPTPNARPNSAEDVKTYDTQDRIRQREAQLTDQMPADFKPDMVDRALRPVIDAGNFIGRNNPLAGIGVYDELASIANNPLSAVRSAFVEDPSSNYNVELQARRNLAKQDMENYPVAAIGSQIATSLPLAGAQFAAKGAGLLSNAIAGAKTGAAYGGLAGFMGGQGGLANRLEGGATGATIGAVLGAPLGALGGVGGGGNTSRLANQSDEVLAAAERSNVPLSRAAASDSAIVRQLGEGGRQLPFVGTSLEGARQNTINAMGQRLDDVAMQSGGLNAQMAGQDVREGIINYIQGTSKANAKKLYDKVDEFVRPDVTAPLLNTAKVAQEIARKNNSAALGESNAAKIVSEAINRPEGLNYEGVKRLRTTVGEMLDDGLLPSNISKSDLKQIYGSLSDDLRNIVQQSGGNKALGAFEKANQYNAGVSARREQLAKIIGKNEGQLSDEAIFNKLVTYAGDKGSANINLLAQARKAVGGEDWQGVASGLVSRIGRDANGDFSPQRFVTEYGKFSDAGKNVLFGGTENVAMRRALDDIKIVSDRLVDIQKLSNPSGTGRQVGFLAAVANPIQAVTSAVGGGAMASILSQPATASSMAKWARAYEMAVKKPAAGTISSLQIATRNFAATIGDKLGLKISPEQITRSLVPSYADEQNQEAGGVSNPPAYEPTPK
jgi:hypothetical protein